jgi:phenylacetaldehyde dehydrogenase
VNTATIDSRVSAPTTAFLSRDHRLLINDEWVAAASGKTFPVYNPATGTVLAQVAEADKEDVDRAVRAARQAFDAGPWRKRSGSQRGRLLWKLSDLVEQHLEELAELESLDNGKPFSVARVADVPLTVDMFVTWADGRPS